MRSAHLLVLILAIGVTNAQFSGMISGLVEGLTEGGIKGVVGAYAPLVKDGMSMMYNLAQTMIRTNLGLIDSLIKVAPQLMTTLQNMFSGIFSSGTNLIKGFTGGKVQLQQITQTAQHGLTGTFATFGSLNKKDQKAIFGAFEKANQVVLTAAKLQVNSIKTADKEVPVLRQIMESEHKNPQQLFATLKKRAPKLSAFVQTTFNKGSIELRSHTQKLEKSAKTGLIMMHDSIRLSQKGIEKILGSMNGNVKKEFGPMFHLMSNTMHVINAAF